MSLWEKFLDLLFPPRCVFCGALRETASLSPCPRCEKAAFWLSGADAVRKGTHFARCVSVGWYQDALRLSMQRFKFENRPEYAKAYAPLLAEAIRFYLPGAFDTITWMPVSEKTLKKRGYDQAELLARETAAALGMTAVPLLCKTKGTKAQSSLTDGKERFSNVAGVYAAFPEAAGKRILLIDDIITTGATLEEGACTLRAADAEQIVAATFCRTPPHHT